MLEILVSDGMEERAGKEESMKTGIKKYRKYLFLAGVGGLGFLLFYLASVAWCSMLWAKDSVLFYLEEPISVEEALKISEQNQKTAELWKQGQKEQGTPLNFCIWGQKENITVSNEELSRTASADAVILCGNPEILFADCRTPIQEDEQGCLIDEETAWELFGSSQVIGKEILCQGNNYMIRNVIPAEERVVAFQAGSLSHKNQRASAEGEEKSSADSVLQRITVQKPKESSIRDLQMIWAGQYSLSAQVLDTELLRGISGSLLLAIPVTVCIFIWMFLYRQFRVQEKLRQKAVTAMLSLALAALLIFFLGKWVRIPDDYIPTLWSDFSFWAKLWKEKTEGMRLLIRIPKGMPDSEWMDDFWKAAGYSLLAEMLAALWIAGGRRRKCLEDFD